jgi:hypothetical protein
MCGMRGWLIAVTVVLAVGLAPRVRATPLYGGYNGLSTSWVEYKIGDVETSWTAASILFGADTNERNWVRMRISLVPLFMRLEYTRDYLGIQSVAVNTLFPWPVQLGSEFMETPGDVPPWWITAYLILGVGGFASDGTSWTETGIPGVYGIGADSSGNQWLWLKAGNFLQGYGEDFNPVEPEDAATDSAAAQAGPSLHALQTRFDASVAGALARRLQSGAFARAAQACSRSLQAASPAFAGPGSAGNASPAADPACAQVADELVDGATGDGLTILLEDFVREVQPLLSTSLPEQ